MIRAIIFDIGGVLLQTADWRYRHQWDDQLSLAHGTVEELVFNSPLGTAAQLGQVTLEAHWQAVGRHLGVAGDRLAQLRRDFWAGDRFNQSLADLIRQLHGPYQTAVISNAFDDLRQVLTAEFGLADAFDLIVVSAEEGIMKPQAAIYERTLARLDCPPNEAIFIDDNQANIAGAQAVGLQTIHYQRGMAVAEALQAWGVHPS